MGRRWGKSVMGGAVSLATAARGGRVAWIVPTYRNGRPLWRMAEAAAGSLRQAGAASLNRSERVIEFASGGLFGIYSADSPDSIRGESFDLAVLDEAARIPQEAWQDVIQPTLADHDGDAILISTPKGLNWFYEEWKRGRANMREIAGFRAPSADNPNRAIRRAAELARSRVPARTYKQEWLAEFVTDGSYFQGVDECATVTAPDATAQHEGHSIVMGVDWGRTHDATVLTLLCQDCSRVVDWERMTGTEYRHQRARLKLLSDRWGACGILPERNSMGQPNIEELIVDDLPVMVGPDNAPGWNMTAANKPLLVEALALALERGEIQVPEEYADELRAFEITTRSEGAPRFGAPEGAYDDRVISLALSWQAALMSGPVLLSKDW